MIKYIVLLQNYYFYFYRLHGSYDALREGHLCDALVDFTGGVSEVVDIQAEEFSTMEDKRVDFFNMLLHETASHSLMCFTVIVSIINYRVIMLLRFSYL